MLFNREELEAMRAGQVDHDNRLAADRITALWASKSERKPSSLEATPLFDRQETLEETFGEPISVYTDSQAIDDGYLVQLVAPNGNDTGHRVTRAAWDELTAFHREHGCEEYTDAEFARFFICEILPITPAAVTRWEAGDILKLTERFELRKDGGFWLIPNGAGLTLMKPEDY